MNTIIEHGALVIALFNCIFTIAAGAITIYVKLALVQMEIDLRRAIGNASQEIDERIDLHRRETGETLMAIRAKVTEVEIWVRDNYVRRDSFHIAIEKIDKRLERMEEKLDMLRTAP